MRILGIDPGMVVTGYGLIEAANQSLTMIDYGVVTAPKGASVPERLRTLYLGLSDFIERSSPSEVAIELFIPRRLRTAVVLGQARGVAILAAANNNLPVYEYTPLQVKQSVTDYGRAPKEQVQKMVALQLGLSSLPEPDDAADALAVAICHVRQTHLARLLAGRQEEEM